MSGFLSAGIVGGPDIPDSAIANWDASALSGSDGDTITTFPDSVGPYDLSGSATLQTNGINGVQSLSFNGSSNNFTLGTSGWDSIPQPNTTISVIEYQGSNTEYYLDDTEGTNRHQHRWDGSNWLFFAGNSMTGGSSTQTLHTVVWDGSNSEFRANGSQVTTGDVGTRSWDSITVGSAAGGGDYWSGLVGEIVVYDGRLTTAEIESEEQRLADKWNISI